MIKDKRVRYILLMIILWSAYFIFIRTTFFKTLDEHERLIFGLTTVTATSAFFYTLIKNKNSQEE